MSFETDYVYHFIKFPLFGAWFINKIHTGVQKFLHSCALGKVDKLKLQALDFRNILSSVEDRSIAFVRSPAYVKTQFPTNNKGKRKSGDGNGEGQKNKRNKGDTKERVLNNESDSQAKLGSDMPFGEVFCKEVRSGVAQPKMDNGSEMCNRFYVKGYCFQNCSRSHSTKNQSEQSRWKKFLQNIIARYKAKNNGREMPVNTSE